MEVGLMTVIRIPEDRWGEVWKFLVAIGPITRISTDPLYEVTPQHVEALCHAGLPFETVNGRVPVSEVTHAENS